MIAIIAYIRLLLSILQLNTELKHKEVKNEVVNYDYDQIDNVTNTKAVIVQYECDQCKYKTTTLVELTRQIQLDHVKYDYYQNECNQCKYKTTTIVDLTSHIMSELGEVKYDNDHSNNVNTDNTSVKYECELSMIED